MLEPKVAGPHGETILAGLKWLARHQSGDGHWDATGYSKQCEGRECDGTGLNDFDAGLTGLSILAFLDAGFTPQSPTAFGQTVKKGLQWLVDKQGADGGIGPRVGEVMYNHAIATYALAEYFRLRYGGKETPEAAKDVLREPAQRAVTFLEKAQNPGLGWRYTPRSGNNDTSVTGWCVMALRSARLAKLTVKDKTFDGAWTWFDRVTDKNTGHVGYDRYGSGEIYVPGKNEKWLHHPTMAAVAVGCDPGELGLGTNPQSPPSLHASVKLVMADLPKWDPAAPNPPNDFYYWYHGTRAIGLHHASDSATWKTWSRAIVKALVPHQRNASDGCSEGSWDTDGVDRWAYAGGRVYATAINVLTLGVVNRGPEKRTRFVVRIQNDTGHPIEPGFLSVPPKEFIRTLDLKVVMAGKSHAWTLDYVPDSVTVTKAVEFIGPAEAPASEEKKLPRKTLTLGKDYQKDSTGVTITYP